MDVDGVRNVGQVNEEIILNGSDFRFLTPSFVEIAAPMNSE